MNTTRKALLAAGLLAGAAALSGCTASTAPAATPTPKAAQQQTAQPATAQPQVQESAQPADEAAAGEDGGERMLVVDGQDISVQAIIEQDKLLLPLMETGEALGWKAHSEKTEEDTQIRRVISLEKDESRITVSWTVSDNTNRDITWQKDGLLIPVDTRITTLGDVVYVPAAFFEEAMDVSIAQGQTDVMVSTPKPMDTPQTMEESSGENG